MTLDKIKKQVEFYFSDANFRVDAFMKQQSLLNNGYIPIDTILTFKKMKELKASKESVIESLSDSTVVELKDDCLKKIETEEFKNYVCDTDIDSKCVYISGFDTESSLEQVEKIVNKFMTPLLIRMRREKNKKFSGSIFVELSNKEEVEKIVSLKIPSNIKEEDDKDEQIKRQKKDEFLTIMSKKDFLIQKEKISEDKNLSIAKQALKDDYTGKLFKYESSNELEIQDIKKMIKDVAFVDQKERVLRLKFSKDFSDKEFKQEDVTIKIVKLNKEEVEEYCSKIPVRPRNTKKKSKKSYKKENKS
ncbi:hypothetical protein P3W45_000560 [Vairimorpha bombi]|jgi:lupus La protein